MWIQFSEVRCKYEMGEFVFILYFFIFVEIQITKLQNTVNISRETYMKIRRDTKKTNPVLVLLNGEI